jgi:hypothetical protein
MDETMRIQSNTPQFSFLNSEVPGGNIAAKAQQGCPFHATRDENTARLHSAQKSFAPSKIDLMTFIGNPSDFTGLPKQERYKIYQPFLKIFAGELAVKEDTNLLTDLDGVTSIDKLRSALDSKTPGPTELSKFISSSTQRISSALDVALYHVFDNFIEYGQANKYAGFKGNGSLAGSIAGGIATSHTSFEKLFKRILEHLLDHNKTSIVDYRKFVQGGIGLIDEVSSLKAADEKKVIPPMGLTPACNVIFHDSGEIEIPKEIKDTFTDERLGFCPAKMVRLDVNIYGKTRKLSLPQIAFFLAALEVEKLLFSTGSL